MSELDVSETAPVLGRPPTDRLVGPPTATTCAPPRSPAGPSAVVVLPGEHQAARPQGLLHSGQGGASSGKGDLFRARLDGLCLDRRDRQPEALAPSALGRSGPQVLRPVGEQLCRSPGPGCVRRQRRRSPSVRPVPARAGGRCRISLFRARVRPRHLQQLLDQPAHPRTGSRIKSGALLSGLAALAVRG